MTRRALLSSIIGILIPSTTKRASTAGFSVTGIDAQRRDCHNHGVVVTGELFVATDTPEGVDAIRFGNAMQIEIFDPILRDHIRDLVESGPVCFSLRPGECS